MDKFISSITLKEIITWTIAIIGYLLAFWQYMQKTKIDFRFKQYAEKRTLYEKYIVEFAKLNKAAKSNEQSLYEKEFAFKRQVANNKTEEISLSKKYAEDFLGNGLLMAKLLKEHITILDLLLIGSSQEILDYTYQLKRELDRLSMEIHLKLREIEGDMPAPEAAKLIKELSQASKLEKLQSLQNKMLAQMRTELKDY